MRTTVIVLLAATAVGLGEVKVQVKDLPPAVQKTVQEQTRKATLKGVSKEVEGGKTLYEVETVVGGKTRDLMVDASGVVVSVEEEVTLESIPAAARAAIEARAGKNKIAGVESVTKGSAVSYEVVIVRNGKKSEFMVSGDGTPAR